MKKTIILLGLISIYISAQAQDTIEQGLETEDTTLSIPEDWDANLNKLVNSWYVQHYATKIDHEGYQDNTPADDTTYIERLSKLPNIIELPYNNIVRQCIELYVNRRRDLVEYMLGIESFYFPMIEETLDKYDLPLELKYLTIVESALNPTALSRKGASGLWQFMLGTGKIYGLEINSLIDERRDPLKSTDAACRYLKDLFDIYGDWNLVIAAYNCGAGNVNKAIRRANGKADFWKIYQFLPKETRTYVPLFIAANYTMNYYAYHQLYPAQTKAS
ncbi:MAG: lytic transglycosylase domain-containing protein, partial [Dysgonamonadaceae bacterium]|nr:lytic transglycosylase domain-containing protein [Dysgonamonadaceae bacterium]